jgi:hypothetical protein
VRLYWIFHPGGSLPLLAVVLLISPLLGNDRLSPTQVVEVFVGFSILAVSQFFWGKWLIGLWTAGEELLSAEQKEKQQAEYDERLQAQIDDLRHRLESQSPRTLTDAQKNLIIHMCSFRAGQTVRFGCKAGDAEAQQFAQSIYNALKAAGWNPTTIRTSTTFMDDPHNKIQVCISQEDWDRKVYPGAADTLIDTFNALGFSKIPDHNKYVLKEIPAGEIYVNIDIK